MKMHHKVVTKTQRLHQSRGKMPSPWTTVNKVWKSVPKDMKDKMRATAKNTVGELPMSCFDIGIQLAHLLTQQTGFGGGGGTKLPFTGATVASGATGIVKTTKYHSKLLKRPSKIYEKMMNQAQRLEYICTSKYRLASNIGAQAASDYSSGQGATGWSASATGTQGLAIYGGNTYSGTTGYEGALGYMTSLFTGNDVGSGTQGTMRVYHKGCSTITEIASLTAYPIEVDIYECVAKHDLQGLTTTSGGYELNYLQVISPVNYWSSGLSNITSNNLTAQTVGCYPTDSELFNVYWKVCARFKVNLSAGSVHRHESDYRMNTFIDTQRVNYSGILAGITRSLIIVLRGTPVRDATTNESIGYGPASADVLSTHTYKAEAIPYSIMKNEFVSTGSNETTPETVVTDSPTVESTAATVDPA